MTSGSVNYELRIRIQFRLRILTIHQKFDETEEKSSIFLLFFINYFLLYLFEKKISMDTKKSGRIRIRNYWPPGSGYGSQAYGSSDPDPKHRWYLFVVQFVNHCFKRYRPSTKLQCLTFTHTMTPLTQHPHPSLPVSISRHIERVMHCKPSCLVETKLLHHGGSRNPCVTKCSIIL